MAKLPGLPIYHGETQPLESVGGLAPGTAVGLDSNGRAAPVNSGGSVSTVVGVVSHTVDPDHERGEKISIVTGGTVVTSVTSSVTSGGVAASTTDGALTGGSGAGTAFSDAGGTYQGDIPTGYAAVRIGGVQ